jgi:hypothetical protein
MLIPALRRRRALLAATLEARGRCVDLRRTAVSGMARLGVAPHIADKILNHKSGSISGVAAVYQRHEFMDERRSASDLWGNHVRSVSMRALNFGAA